MSELSKEEVDKMIADLKEIKPKVRKTSMFGDNHHNAIDAQIRVLEEDLDEEDINDEVWEDNVVESAMAAREWLDGEETEFGLLEDWKSLIKE